MKIKVLLFAQLKDVCGKAEYWLELPSGSTVQDAVTVVMKEGMLSKLNGLPIRYAVNEEFESPSQALKDRDRLALLAPFAGG